MSSKKTARIILTFFLAISFGAQSFAQNNSDSQTTDVSVYKSGPRKQLSIIFLSGLGGSVLGLSTLSFYGRPQDHMTNIAMGFAIGIVAGTIYVTYNTAKKPKEYLGDTARDQGQIFAQQQTTRGFLMGKKLNPKALSYTFHF